MTGNDSIINVIQKMVQEGEPREKIIKTLAGLGVDQEKAKRLLLIAEADTFTLLKKEISSVVQEQVNSERKNLEKTIDLKINSLESKQKQSVIEVANQGLSDVQNRINKNMDSFAENINKLINTSNKRLSSVKSNIDTINSRLSKAEMDIEEVKVHKFRKSSVFFSYIMLAFGALCLFISVFLMLTGMDSLDNFQIILVAVLLLSSIAFSFASIVS